MSLTTRCPSCGTSFRVHAGQLSARGGRVRCGKCASVFDGVASLVQEPSPAQAAPAPPSPQLGLFEPARSWGQPAGLDAAAAKLRDESGPTAQSLDFRGDGGTGPPRRRPVKQAEDSRAAAAPPRTAAPAIDWQEAPAPVRRWPWAILALLAGAALAAQVAYRFRTEIAVLVPATRAYLEAACEFADCRVGLPRHADLLSIDSSDLQRHAQRSDLIVLNALLHNRAQFPQELPALELTLTDNGDRPVVRRVLLPGDYLGRPAAGTPAIGPGAELLVRVHFDASKVSASGYRLYLFYP